MKFKLLLFTTLLFVFVSCKNDDMIELTYEEELKTILKDVSPTGNINYFLQPEATAFAEIPQDPKNILTTEKVELGKLLFHETGLGLSPIHPIGKGTYSCASCHFADAGFQAGRRQGIGDGGIGVGFNGEGRIPFFSTYSADDLDVQPNRSPSAMNAAWQEAMLYNGQFGATGINVGTEHAWGVGTPKEVNHLGFHGLESQAIAGLEVHRMEINEIILDTLGYKETFDVVFWNLPEAERYTKITAGLAIAAYERTLLSNQAPFQLWLKDGRNNMAEEIIKGAILFFDEKKGNCVSCHTGPSLSSMEFYALGMKDLYQSEEEIFQASEVDSEILGRGGFTGRSEDMYKFKVPQLYNLIDSPFFGHGSSFQTLKDLIHYKNNAEHQKLSVPRSQLADDFVPLGLTNQEINDLVAFLEEGLRDPNLQRYEPPALPSGNCFPFNDELSQIHLGCN